MNATDLFAALGGIDQDLNIVQPPSGSEPGDIGDFLAAVRCDSRVSTMSEEFAAIVWLAVAGEIWRLHRPDRQWLQ